jgi:hypothetical protein
MMARLDGGRSPAMGCLVFYPGRAVHRLLHDCLLLGDGCALSFLISRLDVRIELGRLTAIGHSVVSDDLNAAMAQFAPR